MMIIEMVGVHVGDRIILASFLLEDNGWHLETPFNAIGYMEEW